MRRVALTVSGLSLSFLLALPGAALGHGTVDQENTTDQPALFHSQFCPAQTFTAELSGSLVGVSVLIRSWSDVVDLLVQIRDTDNGAPGDTVLASAVVSRSDVPSDDLGWVHVHFASPARSEAGTTYALVLSDSGGDPDASGFAWGYTFASDQYAGGGMFGRPACDGPYQLQPYDAVFQTFVGEPQPDGRIRRVSGGWVGGNIYNTTAVGQSRSAEADRRNEVVFKIQVQNDGNLRDKFSLDASGPALNGYRVTFLKRTTDITDRVDAGTFETRWLDPGERATIEAWVKVQAGASEGSSISRLVTLSSLTDPTKVDAVRFTVSRR